MNLVAPALFALLLTACVARSEPEGPGAPPPPPAGSPGVVAGTVDAGAGPGFATPPPPPAVDAGVVAANPPPPPPSPPCMRQHKAWVARCSGMAPRPGEPNGAEVQVCDHCISDADCSAHKGGRCLQVGGRMCAGPAHLECRYPSAECGGQICPERPPSYPPSAPPRPDR